MSRAVLTGLHECSRSLLCAVARHHVMLSPARRSRRSFGGELISLTLPPRRIRLSSVSPPSRPSLYFISISLRYRNTMMSGLMGYFGGRRDSKQSAREAIVNLRQQLQMLEKKEDHLQKKIDEEVKKAKANAVTNKAGTSVVSPPFPGQVWGKGGRVLTVWGLHSGDAGAPEEEDGGAGARPARGDTVAARVAGEHARVGQLECGDAGRDEEGLGGAQDHSQGHVRIHMSLLCECTGVDCSRFPRTVEQVEATMDSINEQRGVAEEIGRVISDPMNAGIDMDDVRPHIHVWAPFSRCIHRRTCRRNSRISSRTSSTSVWPVQIMYRCTHPQVPSGNRVRACIRL
jgi:hypothetical protein